MRTRKIEPCPTDEALAQHLAGDAREEAIAEHIDRCEDCAAVVAIIARSKRKPGDIDVDAQSIRGAMLAAGTRVDQFEVECLIGWGGMGEVYRARDTQLDRAVALKILLAHDNRSLLQEARLTAQLSHPNIVTVYQVGIWQDKLYLALEHVEGTPLTQSIGKVTPSRALELACIITDAVAFAHGAGICHLDLKPDNVILASDGRPKIVDFGLARIADSIELEAANAANGTPRYMAPETWLGRDPAEPADVWATGLMLHELFSGEHPIKQDTMATVRHAVVSGDFKLAKLPPSQAELIEQCLHLQPGHRIKAGALHTRLQALREASQRAPQSAAAEQGEAPSRSFKDYAAPTRVSGPYAPGRASGAYPPAPGADAMPLSMSSQDLLPLSVDPRAAANRSPEPDVRDVLAPRKQPRQWPRRVLIVIVVLGLAFAWRYRRLIQETVTGRNTSEVLLHLDITPKKAKVFIDDVETPSRILQRDASEKPMQIRVEARGFRAKTLRIIPDHTHTVRVRLKRVRK